MLVWDASAVAKLFRREPGHEEALALREKALESGQTLAAPALLTFEVGQVVRRTHNGEPAARQAEVAAAALAFIHILPSKVEEVLRLAGRHLSFYDAAYLEVAVREGATLVTGDAALAKEAARHKVAVHHLGAG